jgi:hypothetical protein
MITITEFIVYLAIAGWLAWTIADIITEED